MPVPLPVLAAFIVIATLAAGAVWFLRNRWRRVEDEVDEEIKAHLAIATADRVADGLDPVSARQASLRDFGNLTLTSETARRVWTPRWWSWLHDVWTDLRYAVRALSQHRAFSLTVITVLTLGIGLNAAVFTMVKSMALAPLSGVDRSSDLVTIHAQTTRGRDLRLSYPDFVYMREHNRAFSGLMGYRLGTVTIGRGQQARQVSSELVSGNYFDVLGVQAQVGRTLQRSDETAPGQNAVVVLSDRLWRSDFGADPGIAGRAIEVNNRQLTIVGVADPAFHGTIVSYDVELFISIMAAPELGFTFGLPEGTPASQVLTDRTADILYPMGFLAPGESVASAQAQASAIWTALQPEHPANSVVTGVRTTRFWRLPGSAQSIMLPLLVTLSVLGLLILAIACANVAGLVVVRALARRGEVAVRLALGASRGRIVRLLVAESLVLAAPGAILGILLMRRAIDGLIKACEALAAPQQIYFNAQTDALVVIFTVVVACGSAMLVGFLPALRTSRVDLVSAIKEETPRHSGRGRFRGALVVAQVAVSLVLLVASGLMGRSLQAARTADHGFTPQGVTAVDFDLKTNAYDEARGLEFHRRLLEASVRHPDVESASLAQYHPLSFLDTRLSKMTVEGYEPKSGEDLAFLSNVVGPDYFRTLRVPVLAGREFAASDDGDGMAVAMVNRTWAEQFWGSAAAAIGKRIRVADGAWRTVVGVAEDLKYARVDESPRPYAYVPLFQSYRSALMLHIRGTGSESALVDHARASLAAVDPNVPVLGANTMQQQTRGSMIVFEMLAFMLFNFGLVGMAMAGLGTYGLVSYAVRQSTHEIGIRMALGATRSAIIREFVRRGLRLGAVGIAFGLALAYVVGQPLSQLLFGVSPTDLSSFGQALVIVIGGVMLASIIPAWRGARVNPLLALRHR